MIHEKALNDLKKFAETFSGLFDLAEFMRDIGSVEQAAQEAKQRLIDYQQKEQDAKNSLAISQKSFEDWTADQEAVRVVVLQELENIKAMSIAIQDEARQAANDMLDNAANKVSEQTSAGKAEAEKLVAQARAEFSRVQIESENSLTKAQKLVEDELKKRDQVIADIDNLKTQRDSMLSEIEAIKRKFNS